MLAIMGALNGYVVELMATKAKTEDVQAMRDALRQINDGLDIESVWTTDCAASLIRSRKRRAISCLALCRFLASVHIRLAKELTGDSYGTWRKTTRRLAKHRQRLVDAIATCDGAAAREAVRAHIEHSATVTASLPGSGEKMLADPALAGLPASMLQRS